FCVHRVDDDRTPACVEACTAENHNAMIFGDLNDPSSELAKELQRQGSQQIRADLQLNTGVRYRGI
ncbi:MAG: 4Fe-4S ferredoxin, partial [Gammaproteobacteria bacterium]|nr:4Fe-4S ferredoxin [Gammaproteobacteria bacterium]